MRVTESFIVLFCFVNVDDTEKEGVVVLFFVFRFLWLLLHAED